MDEDVNVPSGAALVGVVAAVTGALLSCGVALATGRTWSLALAAAVLFPMAVSTLLGLVLLGLAVSGSPRQAVQSIQSPASAAPRPPHRTVGSFASTGVSTARRQVEQRVEELERQLTSQTERAPEDVCSLMSVALELHAARLRLAGVLLKEQGRLPQQMKDELLVAHRGFADVLGELTWPAPR